MKQAVDSFKISLEEGEEELGSTDALADKFRSDLFLPKILGLLATPLLF
jgi:hypothetical protein